jgi:hypothetical protein
MLCGTARTGGCRGEAFVVLQMMDSSRVRVIKIQGAHVDRSCQACAAREAHAGLRGLGRILSCSCGLVPLDLAGLMLLVVRMGQPLLRAL